MQSPQSETDCLFNGFVQTRPSIKPTIDLRVGEVFLPVPYVVFYIFNNDDRSLVGLSEYKGLLLSSECSKCFMHSQPEVLERKWERREGGEGRGGERWKREGRNEENILIATWYTFPTLPSDHRSPLYPGQRCPMRGSQEVCTFV